MNTPFSKHLRNLHNAMDYDNNNGQPLLRVSTQPSVNL